MIESLIEAALIDILGCMRTAEQALCTDIEFYNILIGHLIMLLTIYTPREKFLFIYFSPVLTLSLAQFWSPLHVIYLYQLSFLFNQKLC